MRPVAAHVLYRVIWAISWGWTSRFVRRRSLESFGPEIVRDVPAAIVRKDQTVRDWAMEIVRIYLISVMADRIFQDWAMEIDQDDQVVPGRVTASISVTSTSATTTSSAIALAG